MESENAKQSTIALANWLATPGGCYVRAWEEAQLAELTVNIFGFNALQIGLPQIAALEANRMPHKFLSDSQLSYSADGQVIPVSVLHDFTELPFASQSIDLVVLPHVLEFSHDPHQILREVERVLMPEGQLIISGFNPASLWGMRQACGRLTGRHFLPANGEFIGMLRLKDWLKLLNMPVAHAYHGCYAPAFTSQAWLQRWNFMEKAGGRWWPYFGAVYILQAVKRVTGMHLIGPVWSKSTIAVANGVTASNSYPNNNG